MASDSNEKSFDETLKHLQMLSGLSSNRAAPVSLNRSNGEENPFQLTDPSLEAIQKNEAVVKQIFGSQCQCGAERVVTMSSGGSASLSGKGSITGKHSGSSSLEHGIINPTPFKHKARGEKKAVVRESMLKNIGKCVHQSVLKQNQVTKETAVQKPPTNTFLSNTVSLKPSLSENNIPECFTNDSSDDMLDFRLLVAQCSELTLSTQNQSNGSKPPEAPNYSQNSFRVLRQSDFQLCRSSTSNLASSRRNRKARQLKRCNSTSSLESDSSSNSNSLMQCSGGILGGASSSGSTTNPASLSNSTGNQPSTSPMTSSPSSSASCSTQARLNSTMPCDITIDEMASYFETLVHIPKKMSSMAEMMYI
ncbi:uncharacterized protein LOC129752642 [Uranotaenia lowii]|uniref:uncharacterized protein LOC129752642 n=1 Tax=Uranotaenia lowii TaxID=190385 RepID=UPI00247AE8B4|nr:uncharacterized protein LOC129752642 [Uranotaenia lowii]